MARNANRSYEEVRPLLNDDVDDDDADADDGEDSVDDSKCVYSKHSKPIGTQQIHKQKQSRAKGSIAGTNNNNFDGNSNSSSNDHKCHSPTSAPTHTTMLLDTSSSSTTSIASSPSSPCVKTTRTKALNAGAGASVYSWQNALQLRSVVTSGVNTVKYFTWSCRLLRRKHLLALLFGGIFLLYINSWRAGDDTDQRIPVLHYSHVPGMRGSATEANGTRSIAALDSLRQQPSPHTQPQPQPQLQLQPQRLNSSPPEVALVSNDNSIATSTMPSPTSLQSDAGMQAFVDSNANVNINANANANANADDTLTLTPALVHATALTPTLTPAADFASASVSLVADLPRHHNATPILIEIANQTQIQIETVTQSETTLSVSPSLIHSSTLSSHASSVAAVAVVTALSSNNSNTTASNVTFQSSSTPPPGYLVWSEHCKMPNVEPYTADVMPYFKREPYKACSKKLPLTSVEFVEKLGCYVLRIELSREKSYTKGKMSCSYQEITRNGTGNNADKEFSLSKSVNFYPQITLPSTVESILVKCMVKKKVIYTNGHALIAKRPEINARLKEWELKDKEAQREKPPSVLLIGIDSVSRVNLIRAMPKTAQYLYDNEWFEMSGYNKIDDNTFPNWMALLTGRNLSHALKKCSPYKLGELDKCDIIWKTFREYGYVTGYAEDETWLNTFNYFKLGFEKPPVDYYLRPFLLAAEKHLQVHRKSSLTYCLGYQHTAEFVYNYAIELAVRFKNHPLFGLFWANTFSHNNLSDCSSMDAKMLEYLQRFAQLGIFERSIVIFFSDHGLRFGLVRKTNSGHLEERLPFMFIWLPQYVKQQHPEFVNALSVNKNRLTNPYDMHMTLKHLLKVSGRVDDATRLGPADDCPRCQTLLQPVPHNRSCEEVAIEDHWCTCIPYQSIYRDSALIRKLAQSTVDNINIFVKEFRNGSFATQCRKLALGSIDSAYRAQLLLTGNSTVDRYRIVFYTKPNNGLFEATLRYNTVSGSVEVTGQISRLNTYHDDSACAEDSAVKKYCSCV